MINPPPPKVTPPNYAAAVVGFGQALFGDNWQGDFSRLTGVNRRTLVRLVGAVREGRDYASAPQILAALHVQISPLAESLSAWAHQANLKG